MPSKKKTTSQKKPKPVADISTLSNGNAFSALEGLEEKKFQELSIKEHNSKAKAEQAKVQNMKMAAAKQESNNLQSLAFGGGGSKAKKKKKKKNTSDNAPPSEGAAATKDVEETSPPPPAQVEKTPLEPKKKVKTKKMALKDFLGTAAGDVPPPPPGFAPPAAIFQPPPQNSFQPQHRPVAPPNQHTAPIIPAPQHQLPLQQPTSHQGLGAVPPQILNLISKRDEQIRQLQAQVQHLKAENENLQEELKAVEACDKLNLANELQQARELNRGYVVEAARMSQALAQACASIQQLQQQQQQQQF